MTDQGVRIVFIDNPQEGDSVSFYGQLSGTRFVYNNGLDIVNFEYTNNDSEVLSDPLHRVKIGAAIQETADNTKLFLDTNGYQISGILINNVIKQETYYFIDSSYVIEDEINFEISTNTPRVLINSFFTPSGTPTIKQKYLMRYKNIVGDEYVLRILKKDYQGESTDIFGRITLEKNEVRTHFDIFRGTGLSIEIEANKDLNIDDLYIINEREFIVRLEKNNLIIYNGFLKPDGVFQSFVYDQWVVSLSSVDGLGFLENLSFVQENGLRYIGKMNCLEIIQKCLLRTGSNMRIKTYINVFYDGLTIDNDSTDILKNVYLDTNRFIKQDDNTVMSCKDVLNSVLSIFKAVITQENGEWYIYRPSDFYNNNYPKFRYYDLNLNSSGTITKNIFKKIGSQIDGFYPHHCNANQMIEVEGAISAFRLGYKYGFLGSLLGNGNLLHDAGTTIYEDWDVQTWDESIYTGFLVVEPTSTQGIRFISATSIDSSPRQFRTALLSTSVVPLYEDYTLEFKTRFISYGFPVFIRFIVRVGIYYLNFIDGSWSTTPLSFDVWSSREFPNGTGAPVSENFEINFSLKSQPLPEVGDLSVQMYVPQKGIGGSFTPLVDVKSIEVINTFSGNNILGEFHTVSRNVAVSSIVKENETVYNGDNDNAVYIGAIYKNDQESFTSNWYRLGKVESKPILRISAEDELRIAQKPNKKFTGDIYGQIKYVSVIEIESISGVFMPIGYSYDTVSNISKLKFLEFFNNELSDIDYLKTMDYGETVKPTIIG